MNLLLYRAVVEGLLCFGISAWFGNLKVQYKAHITWLAMKIMAFHQNSWPKAIFFNKPTGFLEAGFQTFLCPPVHSSPKHHLSWNMCMPYLSFLWLITIIYCTMCPCYLIYIERHVHMMDDLIMTMWLLSVDKSIQLEVKVAVIYNK